MLQTLLTVRKIPNFVGGKQCDSMSSERGELLSPVDGASLGELSMSTRDELNAAVQAAAVAQRAWSGQSLKDRIQVLFRLKTLIEQHTHELAQLITRENGKLDAESRGEISRAVECIEFATSLPQIAAGQVLEVSRGVECKLSRFPLGVVAAITPFNFPLMVPLWMVPTALAMGNAVIVKPSEQTPLSPLALGRLLDQAGLPAGVYSVVQGARDIVEGICDHPLISAIGFVGSTKVAELVYRRGSAAGKRVKALGGAKNHLIVMPDADPEMTIANVVASSTGCAGQRCMAASVLLAVGDTQHIIDGIADRFRSMRAGRDIGAIISHNALERITGYIQRVDSQGGAKLLVDGRGAIDPAAPTGGNYLGPTLFDYAQPDHEVSCDEIFGPTLTVVRCASLDEALRIENQNPYGNAAAVYTSSGEVADYFCQRASAGMVGVNVGVPVPREPFPFGGWNASSFGQGDLTGQGCFEFWSKTKKITTKWTDKHRSNWMS
ncbi:MAG: CoA-acylating methylmalonate-semialdehyde dehydrogenase [Pirellulaceae bacterium]|nr:CoA-acylating methylmalonate-semialdehyde dehydrogenase [Pirellulaceae bacterium]